MGEWRGVPTMLRRFAPPVIVLLAIVAFLWPTLRMPFLGDDTFNAYIDGWIGYEHLSLGAAFREFFQQYGLGLGRFDPIFPLIVFFNYHVMHSIVATKILVLAAIVINAASLYVLVGYYNRALALPTLIALPAVFQIRFFHDPLIQFSLHLQITLEFVLLAAIALTLYSRTSRIAYAVVSIALYLCAALAYEATYAFVVPFVILVIASIPSLRKRIVLCVAYAAVPVALSAIILVLRTHTAVPASSPYAVTFLPTAVLRVIVLQVIGVVPLSYALADPNQSLPPFAMMWRSAPQAWVVGGITFALAIALFRSPVGLPETKRAVQIAAFAFTALLASTAMIALSPRWQSELKLGLAYTPVYFESFAMSVILAACASIVVRKLPFRFGVVLVSGALAIVVGTTYRANALTLAQYTAWSTVVPRAIDAGVLRDARDGDAVYLDQSYPAHALEGGTWDAKYYLYAHTGKRLAAHHLDALPAAAGNAFVLAGNVTDFETGRVVAARIARISQTVTGSVALVDHASIFEANPGSAGLTAWTSPCGPLPFANVVAGISSPLLFAYDAPFSVPERDGTVPFRWAAGAAHIIVENPTPVARHATIQFLLRPSKPAAHVRYWDGKRIVDRATSGPDVAAKSSLRIPANGSASIFVDSDNDPIVDPSGRTLRFEVRDVRAPEPVCASK